jgi:hypothetical protein
MVAGPREILRQGRCTLDPVLFAHGFSLEDGGYRVGSGGSFASGSCVNRDRRREICSRYSLGLVAYHFGKDSLDHASYVRAPRNC